MPDFTTWVMPLTPFWMLPARRLGRGVAGADGQRVDADVGPIVHDIAHAAETMDRQVVAGQIKDAAGGERRVAGVSVAGTGEDYMSIDCQVAGGDAIVDQGDCVR